MRRISSLITLILIIGLTSYAYSRPSVDLVYQVASPKLMRSAVAVVDSAALDGASNLLLATIPTNGKPTLCVNVKHSIASSTCVVTCVRGDFDPTTGAFIPQSITHQTATGAARYTINSLFPADALSFNTFGYPQCMVIVDAPSSGSVTVTASAN